MRQREPNTNRHKPVQSVSSCVAITKIAKRSLKAISLPIPFQTFSQSRPPTDPVVAEHLEHARPCVLHLPTEPFQFVSHLEHGRHGLFNRVSLRLLHGAEGILRIRAPRPFVIAAAARRRWSAAATAAPAWRPCRRGPAWRPGETPIRWERERMSMRTMYRSEVRGRRSRHGAGYFPSLSPPTPRAPPLGVHPHSHLLIEPLCLDF